MARIPVTIEPLVPSMMMINVESLGLTPEQFFLLCGDNPELRFELTAQKEIVIMSPCGSDTGWQNGEIVRQLGIWARENGSGLAFDASAGFTLPNGAMRCPDASWILRNKYEELTVQQRKTYAPICPDFVVELRSPSDALRGQKAKLEEYIANGARLGFLIDPFQRKVYVYRPGHDPEVLNEPASVSGEPVLHGFTLDLTEIYSGPAASK